MNKIPDSTGAEHAWSLCSSHSSYKQTAGPALALEVHQSPPCSLTTACVLIKFYVI